MANEGPEANTRLRARQLQRFHAKGTIKAPQPNANLITAEDLRLANLLEPDLTVKSGPKETDYDEKWLTSRASLQSVLSHFRRSAKALEAKSQGEKVEDVEDESQDLAVNGTEGISLKNGQQASVS